ncbi:MAG: UDP-N-acetylmuramate--L-alanine ligase [Oligoflexales bacterium]
MHNNKSKIYFVGICGTGMASCAGLFKEAGYDVVGSDQNIYPPMSTMLEDLKIQCFSPYSKDNIKNNPGDTYVIANALSRGNDEIEYILEQKLSYTSFPALLGKHFLKDKFSIVVAGTHGKTTTTSLLASILTTLGLDPNYIIGGIPKDLPQSFKATKSPLFVIEGDEYDTAFFDKGSKFLHYCPDIVIFNNLEFDHADIFSDLAAIEKQFTALLKLLPDPKNIIANVDDPGVVKLLQQMGIADHVTRVSTLGTTPRADVVLVKRHENFENSNLWAGTIKTNLWGETTFKTKLVGAHNIANIAQAVACLERLVGLKMMPSFDKTKVQSAIGGFQGVKRRLEHLGVVNGIDVFEDFAHHPTAVKTVIEGFKKSYPGRRLLVAFEPKNATSRRNLFVNEYVKAFELADRVYLGECPVDKRIEESSRMDTAVLSSKIGNKAQALASNQSLLEQMVQDSQQGDALVFMSSGSFSGVQHSILEKLRKKYQHF